MIRAAFFGSTLIAGKYLPDPTDRFSTVASRIMGWDEMNFGHAGSRVTGRDESGRIVSTSSGVARAQEVVDAAPDIAVVLFGEEDFATSELVGERRIGLGVDSVASVPAATQDRRSPREHTGRLVRRARVVDEPRARHGRAGLHIGDETSPLVIRSFSGGVRALPGTFAGDFDAVLNTLETGLKPGQIYVMTPPYQADGERANDVGLTLTAYVEAVRKIARQHEVVVLDTFHDCTIQAANYTRVTSDGVLNAEGHQHLAAFLIEQTLR